MVLMSSNHHKQYHTQYYDFRHYSYFNFHFIYHFLIDHDLLAQALLSREVDVFKCSLSLRVARLPVCWLLLEGGPVCCYKQPDSTRGPARRARLLASAPTCSVCTADATSPR